ncbi:hypothetical protein MNAN1_000489 [Malassezia nana]|uniref:AB hydrolase-1 domain-containing protein n=1 Tax=Malassezia nana TaxID=180528 RepID=A0AAF0EIW6_9BASI|nr:hypothetical protein MNAN1_000489 [Malassezia nana]
MAREAPPVSEPILDDAGIPPLPLSIRPIPRTIFASISAWWSISPKQTAEAEFHLFRSTGYFRGAQLGNAKGLQSDGPNAIVEAYRQASEGACLGAHRAGNQYATVATKPHHGKIGCLRAVDLGVDPRMRRRFWWFGARPARYLHMLEIGTPTDTAQRPPDEVPVVFLHGYGAGCAFFFKNVGAIASLPRTRVFALDWLGMGCSARPPYRMAHAPRSEARVEASEQFFVESLEQWRAKMQLERMVLVGHSLGGYLSVAYALQYPERVARLVLVSPAGIPEGSLSQDQVSARFNPLLVRTLRYLWDHNVSPFGLLRMTLGLGPMLMGSYTRRRFGALDDHEMHMLHAYCHGIFTARASSEHCLSDLLAPGAYARRPMVHRMAPLRMPISFFYGDRDWMDEEGGRMAQRLLSQAGHRQVNVSIVPNAGHHVYLDHVAAFNEHLQRLVVS